MPSAIYRSLARGVRGAADANYISPDQAQCYNSHHYITLQRRVQEFELAEMQSGRDNINNTRIVC